MLGALATATIAAPLAAAAADQGEAQGAALPASVEATGQQTAVPAAEAEAPAEEAAALVLPVVDSETGGEDQYTDVSSAANLAATADTAASVSTPTSGPAVVATGTGWQNPTPGASVTSSFGYRIHPTLGYSKLHEGVDFGAACGVPVYAAESGTVTNAEYHGTSGNRVRIDHGNGTYTRYYHLTKYSVSAGQSVQKGQQIGTVGSTGRSTGCHLHFGLEKGDGNYVNPMSLWQ